MEVWEVLDGMKQKARKDPELRRRLLAAREEPNPVSSFCRICVEEGMPLYEMDLISYGEDNYAAMRRSTNGGGENSPMLAGEDDYFELFMTELEKID